MAVHPEYGSDGVLTRVLLTGTERGPTFQRWLELQYDDAGRITHIADNSGEDVRIGYDRAGEPAEIVSKRTSVKVERDTAERVTAIRTSWGDEQRNSYTAADGMLARVEITREGAHAVVD